MNLSTVLAIAVGLLGVVLVCLLFFQFSLYGYAKSHPPQPEEARCSIRLNICVCHSHQTKRNGTAFNTVHACIYFFLVFLFPLITQRKVPGISAKFDAQDRVDDSFETLTDWIGRVYGINGLTLLLLIIISFFLANTTGKASAKFQEDYILVEGNPQLVALRVYGNHLVCAPIRIGVKEVEPVFTILNLTNSTQASPLKLRWEKIGPLTLQSDSNSPPGAEEAE